MIEATIQTCNLGNCRQRAWHKTRAGTLVCEAHWREAFGPLPEEKQRLLSLAEACGWPELAVMPHLLLAGGEACWRFFIEEASDKGVEEALKKLEGLVVDG